MKTPAFSQNFLLLVLASFLASASHRLHAQTWDGGGVNNDWTTPVNWNLNVAPLNNGTAPIVFAGNVRLTPNVNVPQDIFSLTFASGSGAFTLGGSGLTVRSGGITNDSSSLQRINTPLAITSGSTQTWSMGGGLSFGGSPLVLGAPVSIVRGSGFGGGSITANISGSGSLTVNETSLSLSGANSYFGGTTINGGSVSILGNNALSPSSVRFGTNGTLGIASGVTAINNGLFDTIGGGRINLGSASSLSISSGSFSIFNGVISGPSNASLIVDGDFMMGGTTLILGGSNTFSGTIMVTNGAILATSSSERLADTATLIIRGDDAAFSQSFFALGDSMSSSNLVETVGSVTVNPLGSIISANPATLICDSFTLNGGSVDVTVINRGTFDYNAGWIGGRIVNRGFLDLSPALNVTFGNGLANIGTLAVPAGGVLTFNGEGLDNQSWLTLANSTLTGDGGLTNNNLVLGNGILGGTNGFVNNAQLTLNGGNLNLNNTGINFNLGNIDLAPNGPQLRLNGGQLKNGGSINLNGGSIAGSALLDNGPGGTIVGRGTILSPFANSAGMVLRDNGALNILQSFSSGGTIQLTGAGASLTGGAINNTGTIQGLGNVGNPLANDGMVEAIGGTLNLSGSVLNNPNGLMTALSGGKIVVSGGLANNAGAISISSGTFDNNNRPLNNTGQISGYGAFRSGGLANNGSVTFSGGFSMINGNVTNQATRRISVAYDPAIFTGTVVNNGTFKVTSTIVQFTGTYIENGLFASDPATNSFVDLIIGDNGCLIGELGDAFVISGNLENRSAKKTQWSTGQAELVLRGGPSHIFHLPGADLGPDFANYANNFAWRTFRLGSGESLVLQDGNGASGAALYTRSLVLEGGLGQISAVTGNGFNIYYDPTAPANAYLGGNTFALANGGAILPITLPPIRITGIVALTNSVIQLTATGVPNESHSLLASTNLINWIPLGSITAAADGRFTFSDTNAPMLNKRFYRLSFP